MTSKEPLTTFEDVMAFIDGFDPALAMDEDGIMRTLFAGFTSDISDENTVAVVAPSNELCQFLDSMTTLKNAKLAGTTETSSSQTAQSFSGSASLTEPLVAVAVAAATTVDGGKKQTKRKLKEDPVRPRCSHHERVKQEIRYLRSRAVELEDQLTALRHGATGLSPQQQELINSSWKRIAHRQLEARAESEAENARMRAELRGHFEASRNLESMLAELLDHEFVVDDDKPKSKKGRASKTWEVEGLAELADSLDAAFERLDHVISDTCTVEAAGDSTRSCLLRAATSETGEMTPFIEVSDTTVTPFRPRVTAKAVWRFVLQHYFQHSREDYCVQKIWQTGNTIAAKCRIKYTLKNKGGREMFLNSKVVLRKYVDEESRMVLVWRAHNEGEGDLAGVYADETGWSVVQPISGAFGHSTSGSVVRTCVHVVQRHRATSLVLDPMVAQQHPAVGLLTDLAVAWNEEDLLDLAKAVESLLLDKGNSGI